MNFNMVKYIRTTDILLVIHAIREWEEMTWMEHTDYICSSDKYNEEWNKSYDELVQEWNQYIETHYSQYSRNDTE